MNKINILLLIIVISLFFVKKPSPENDFEQLVYEKVYLSSHIKTLAKTKELLLRPPQVQVEVLEIYNHNKECFKLDYILASIDKSVMGSLLLYSGCKEDRKLLSTFDNLLDLSFSVNTHLTINMVRNKKKVQLKIPLINIKQTKTLSTLSSSSTNRYFDGVVLISSSSLKNRSPLGANESFEERKAISCHKISDECEELGPNTCDQCSNGYYEVIGKYNCENKLNKFCGVDRCGEKGWPACRKHSSLKSIDNLICVDKSPIAFCNKDLEVLCVNDELVCL